MKIAFLVLEVGNDGIGMYMTRLAELLPMPCDLIAGEVAMPEGPLLERMTAAFNQIHEKPTLFGSIHPWLMGRIRGFLKDQQYDILHLHALHLLKYYSLPAQTLGIPIVGTSHLQALGSKQWHGIEKRVFSLGLSSLLADKYVAISSEMEAEYRKTYHIPQNRIERIPTGIDLDHFRPPQPDERERARSAIDCSGDDLVFVHMSRLNEVKAPDATLTAVAALMKASDRPMKLVFAGEGPLQEELAKTAETLGVADNVRILGFRPARDVLWAADVLCLPSRAEGFAMVVVEAMACGVVPVRSKTAGYQDQMAEIPELGWLDADAPAHNVEALKALLDDERRSALAAKCRDVVARKFDQAGMRDAMAAVYERLLA